MLANAAEPKPPITSSAQASENAGASGISDTHTRNSSEPPTISTRPLPGGSPPASHSPPRNAPNDSAAASMPTSVGDTMKCCRPIGATSAE